MKTLEKISGIKIPSYPDFTPDHFQENILNNLFLEILVDNDKFLFSPQNEIKSNNGEAQQNVEEMLAEILENKEQLNSFRKYLVYNFSVYSDLLECNSYLITSNRWLIIARVLLTDETMPYDFEVQLYTIDKLALQNNYTDKIYIGRDFISTRAFKRDHLGLDNILNSIVAEFYILKEKFGEYDVPDDDEIQYYMRDIEQSIIALSENSLSAMEQYPADLAFTEANRDILYKANYQFREIKHQLQDIMESLTDWEKALYSSDYKKFARYITKFKKDIINNINYINSKVNSRITDFLNNIRF